MTRKKKKAEGGGCDPRQGKTKQQPKKKEVEADKEQEDKEEEDNEEEKIEGWKLEELPALSSKQMRIIAVNVESLRAHVPEVAALPACGPHHRSTSDGGATAKHLNGFSEL